MRVIRFVFISLITMLLVCYVYHKSILAYIVQHYHYASDMIAMQIPFLEFSEDISNKIENMRLTLFESENTLDLKLPQDSNMNASDTEFTTKQDFQENDNAKDLIQIDSDPIETNNEILKENIKSDKLLLRPKTRFLLIGDSLMQGIGMVLPRMLQQRDFRVKNIAKQSTGLTYPSFFDWEQATKQAFKQYDDIGVLVVCLGANDPWSMPKIRFGTELWEQTYRGRIQAIFDIAKAYNANVVWYAVPETKNEKLNKKLAYLNDLYKDMTYINGGIFLSSEAILQNGKFSAYLKDEEGKSRLVRASDGIHFTPYGAKLLAKMLLDHIEELQEYKENAIEHENMIHKENDDKGNSVNQKLDSIPTDGVLKYENNLQ